MKWHFIFLAFFMCCIFHQAVAEERAFFRHLTPDEVSFVLSLYREDEPFQEYITSGFIHVAQDVRILYYDLNDDGEDEVLLYMRAGAFCGTAGCDVDIWQKDGDLWQTIGQVKTVDKGITILSKKTHGFHIIHGVDETFRFNGEEY